MKLILNLCATDWPSNKILVSNNKFMKIQQKRIHVCAHNKFISRKKKFPNFYLKTFRNFMSKYCATD